MEFFLILGALCIILGAFLFPFHKKVRAEKFHAYAFLILGIVLVVIPFPLGLTSLSDWDIPLPNLAMVLLFLLLIPALCCVIWFFKAGNTKKGIISLVAAAVITISLFATIFAFSPKYNTNTEVIIAAQLAVESNLKAPSTARFSPSSETTVTEIDDDTYLISGWVEAQNSFGAIVRNGYTVKLTYSNGKSTIEYCNIQ